MKTKNLWKEMADTLERFISRVSPALPNDTNNGIKEHIARFRANALIWEDGYQAGQNDEKAE